MASQPIVNIDDNEDPLVLEADDDDDVRGGQ